MSELSEAIGAHNIKIVSTFQGVETIANDRYQFRWSVAINDVEFSYFTGSGHREKFSHTLESHTSAKACYVNGQWHSAKEAVAQRYIVPTMPDLADVLSCLFLDAAAASETFDNWCDNFGYDTDSRKALATYLECQTNGSKIAKAIGQFAMQALRDLEH